MAPRILIHAHVYYPDLWPELEAAVDAFVEVCGEVRVSLYVTYPEDRPEVAAAIRARRAEPHLLPVPNRGYDVGPFFEVLSRLSPASYDYVVKLHTKRDVPACYLNFRRFEGGQWRRELLSFARDAARVRRTLAAFAADPALGMQAGRRVVDPSGVGSARDCEGARRVVRELGLKTRGQSVVYGTMFIVRAVCLEPVWGRLAIRDFAAPDPRHPHDSFGLAGDWEGGFGVLVNALGYDVGPAAVRSRFLRRALCLKEKLRNRSLRALSNALRPLVTVALDGRERLSARFKGKET